MLICYDALCPHLQVHNLLFVMKFSGEKKRMVETEYEGLPRNKIPAVT